MKNFHVMNVSLARNNRLEFHYMPSLVCPLQLLNLTPVGGVRCWYLYILHHDVKVVNTPVRETERESIKLTSSI